MLALQLLFSTALAADGWDSYDSINNDGDLVVHSMMKSDEDMRLSYACYSETGKAIGSKLSLQMISHEGTWAPINEPLVHEADPAVMGNNLIISLVTGNSISTIKSWRITECEDCLIISKNFGDIHSPAIDAQDLSVSQLKEFRTAGYVAVTVNGDTYRLSLSGSSAALASTDAACGR